MRYLILIGVFCLAACAGIPSGIQPVTPFSIESYLGTWYEIARLDHDFEEGLSHVTAEYSLNDDGSIKMRNLGFSSVTQKWEEMVGKANFVGDPRQGYLNVSFRWPFYSSYVIFKLNSDYSVAYVTGGSRRYLWLLARTQTVSAEILADFKATAEAEGFNLSKLVLVNQLPLD